MEKRRERSEELKSAAPLQNWRKAPRTFRRHSRRPSLTLDDTPRTLYGTLASLSLSLRFYTPTTTRPRTLLSRAFSTVFHVLPSALFFFLPLMSRPSSARCCSPNLCISGLFSISLYRQSPHSKICPNCSLILPQQARPLISCCLWRRRALHKHHTPCLRATGCTTRPRQTGGGSKSLEQPQRLDVAILRHFARHSAREAINL